MDMKTSICNNSIVAINDSINCSSNVTLQPPHLNDSTYLFVLPVIVIFGLIGNIFSLLTIFVTNLRLVPANQYLIVLTVSDSVFLLTLVFTLLKLDFIHVYICMAIEYLLTTASYTSSWTITALTVERFLAVYYPLSRLKYGDMERTKSIIGCMLPFPWMLNLVMFGYLTQQPTDRRDVRQCVPRSGAWQISIEVADIVLCYVIPCCVVVILNILVAKRLKKASRERASVTDGQHSLRQVSVSQRNSSSSGLGLRKWSLSAQRTNFPQDRYSRILIVVPVVYLLLNTPFYMMMVASLASNYGFNHILFDINDGSGQEVLIRFYNGAHYLYYLNFAIDFIVYAFSSSHFRRAAMTSWRGICEPKWQQSQASISHAFSRLSVIRTTLILLPDLMGSQTNVELPRRANTAEPSD